MGVRETGGKVSGCRTECDGGDPSEELFRGSDRGDEKESDGDCGGLNS